MSSAAAGVNHAAWKNSLRKGILTPMIIPTMERHSDLALVRSALKKLPQPVALVPTMGALHEGHIALIKEARKRVGPQGSVAVSIFVNPIQFDRVADLQSYPQPLEEDLRICRQETVDLAYTPASDSLYEKDHCILVTDSLLSKHLCGATRPGHFDGVLTVVMKLFQIFQPDFAIFGQKDFQQLALIRRMVRDLNVPVEIIGHPTIREEDGLALSSRNRKLTKTQRNDAPRIQRALRAARDLRTTGQQMPSIYLEAAKFHLEKEAPDDFKIDYLELVDQATLQPVAKLTAPAILATACYYGDIRLIDHLEIIP